MPYYAIHRGQKTGIFTSWEQCRKLTFGYKGAVFKKFKNKKDAEYFVKNGMYLTPQKKDDFFTKKVKNNTNDNTNDTIELEEYDVYTDGCLVRKNGECYAGYGYFIPKLNMKKSYILEGNKTNNRAELMGIITAIQEFENKAVILNIYTDSQYAIWIFGETGMKYKHNNYKTKRNSNKDVPNKDLVRMSVLMGETYKLNFIKIKAHTGYGDEHSKGNEVADILAVKGATIDYLQSCNPGEYKIQFGKYKNIMVQNLPEHYIHWIQSDKFLDLCKKEEFQITRYIVKKYNNFCKI